MATPSTHEVTQLLHAWSSGDQQALEKLTPLVYAELHRRARYYVAREEPGHIIQTTALINEVYLRLIDARGATWQDRAHFLAVCARMMRHILTDFARARHYQKRGGAAQQVPFEEHLYVSSEPSTDLVALDDALNGLAAVDPRKSQVVELRFFGGMNVQETAEILKVSAETVKRDWRLAKLWLLREMGVEHPHGS